MFMWDISKGNSKQHFVVGKFLESLETDLTNSNNSQFVTQFSLELKHYTVTDASL